MVPDSWETDAMKQTSLDRDCAPRSTCNNPGRAIDNFKAPSIVLKAAAKQLSGQNSKEEHTYEDDYISAHWTHLPRQQYNLSSSVSFHANGSAQPSHRNNSKQNNIESAFTTISAASDELNRMSLASDTDQQGRNYISNTGSRQRGSSQGSETLQFSKPSMSRASIGSEKEGSLDSNQWRPRSELQNTFASDRNSQEFSVPQDHDPAKHRGSAGQLRLGFMDFSVNSGSRFSTQFGLNKRQRSFLARMSSSRSSESAEIANRNESSAKRMKQKFDEPDLAHEPASLPQHGRIQLAQIFRSNETCLANQEIEHETTNLPREVNTHTYLARQNPKEEAQSLEVSKGLYWQNNPNAQYTMLPIAQSRYFAEQASRSGSEVEWSGDTETVSRIDRPLAHQPQWSRAFHDSSRFDSIKTSSVVYPSFTENVNALETSRHWKLHRSADCQRFETEAISQKAPIGRRFGHSQDCQKFNSFDRRDTWVRSSKHPSHSSAHGTRCMLYILNRPCWSCQK